MKTALLWLRKVPLVGWLVLALVAVVLLLIRSQRLRALAEAQASAIRRVALARRDLDAERGFAEANRDNVVAIAQDRYNAELERLAAAEERIDAVSGQSLSNEINAFFAPRGEP